MLLQLHQPGNFFDSRIKGFLGGIARYTSIPQEHAMKIRTVFKFELVFSHITITFWLIIAQADISDINYTTSFCHDQKWGVELFGQGVFWKTYSKIIMFEIAVNTL